MTMALQINNLRKTYKNGFEALKGVDLKVAEGDFFALLGPNGAGKSTMIGVISSLVNKTAGDVQVFGYDIDQDWAKAKSCLGVVPQEFNFNQFEPVQQIVANQAGYYGVPRKQALEETERLLKMLDLWDKRSQPSRNLSGGMKRRLMIARALAHRPRLLILDEPTAGVDIELRRSMWEFIQQINNEGTTIILTTHYLEEAEQLCRNIAIIDEGQLVTQGDTKTLLRGLNVETVVLDTREAIAELPNLGACSGRIVDAHTVEVEVPATECLTDLFVTLKAQGISVNSMRNKSNRLEELFLRLVENTEAGDE